MDPQKNMEEKIMCPYNRAHYIRKCRMEVHLTKCRKANQDTVVLVPCDFNSCHRIPEPELGYHHGICPDRKELELQIFCEEAAKPIQTIRPTVPVPVDDSWDDVEVKSYDPKKYCLENQVLRRLDTESAAKRRDFRIAERHRINNLDPVETTRGLSAPTDEAVGNTNQTLPPTRSFPATIVERTPDNITEMLKKLSFVPKRAVIPRQN